MQWAGGFTQRNFFEQIQDVNNVSEELKPKLCDPQKLFKRTDDVNDNDDNDYTNGADDDENMIVWIKAIGL